MEEALSWRKYTHMVGSLDSGRVQIGKSKPPTLSPAPPLSPEATMVIIHPEMVGVRINQMCLCLFSFVFSQMQKFHTYYSEPSFRIYVSWSVSYQNLYILDLMCRIVKMHLSTEMISGLGKKHTLQSCSHFLLPSHLFVLFFIVLNFGTSLVCEVFLVVLIPFSSSGRIF